MSFDGRSMASYADLCSQTARKQLGSDTKIRVIRDN